MGPRAGAETRLPATIQSRHCRRCSFAALASACRFPVLHQVPVTRGLEDDHPKARRLPPGTEVGVGRIRFEEEPASAPDFKLFAADDGADASPQ